MRRLYFTFPLLVLVLVAALWGGATLSYRRGLAELADEGDNRLALYITYLRGVLEKYEGLPELLATNRQLVSFLLNPGSRDRIDALNRYLETINNISDAADTYLMDREGLTIAASNWNKPKPFVGRNFSYRPYFKQAMQGELGRYYALGTTSSERGYYFAYPVRQDKTILGAVVIKINVDAIEEQWTEQGGTFMVTDPDGVIFITTREEWRFRTLAMLPLSTRERLMTSRRYPEASLDPLPIIEQSIVPQGLVVKIGIDREGGCRTFLRQQQAMPHAGWQIYLLSDIRPVQRRVLFTILGIFSCWVLTCMAMLLYWQRRQQLFERQRFEEANRRMLEDANEVLESRVSARTAALTAINRKLRKEIQDRRRTEEELRKTRNELIHAAKLAALGQMSAGVTHELNQPLAAIRTYTDNATQLLEKGRLDDVHWNLEQINELTDRMARLGMQLKIFARKSSGRLSAVPLHGVIDGALEVLAPVISKSDVTMDIRLSPEVVAVRANAVLLQQVLVNLLVNSLQAVEGQKDKQIQIVAKVNGDQVQLWVRDNGPGIRPALAERIFEPFYTTKEPGKGLGLGLTISARIMEEMGGRIRVAAGLEGACFELTLNTR